MYFIYSIQLFGTTLILKSITYLKFTFNWESCVWSGSPSVHLTRWASDPTPQPTPSKSWFRVLAIVRPAGQSPCTWPFRRFLWLRRIGAAAISGEPRTPETPPLAGLAAPLPASGGGSRSDTPQAQRDSPPYWSQEKGKKGGIIKKKVSCA
jgi:hypothetical protein